MEDLGIHGKGPLDRYINLGIPEEKCQITYVWSDATETGVRAKSKTINFIPHSPSEIPLWSYSGSSTGQTDLLDSDLFLHPVVMYNDPFRLGSCKIVLCETAKHEPDGSFHPTPSNQRHICTETMKKAVELEPWFGMEQEYVILEEDGHDITDSVLASLDGSHYCAVGASKVKGRDIVEAHYRACLYAGISIYGSKHQYVLSQWAFQIGPCEGVTAADDTWMARYFMHRVAEDFEIDISLEPKVKPGSWNAAGLHCNFSTNKMRAENGIVAINEAIEKLKKAHQDHLKVYGTDIFAQIPGYYAQPRSELPFTHGIAQRDCAIRIAGSVADAGRGHIEDRRVSANADPYMVANALVRTTCL